MRMVLAANGSNNNAPAISVAGSGMGAGARVGTEMTEPLMTLAVDGRTKVKGV